MSLASLATQVRSIREDTATRDAVVRGDEVLLEGSTDEEKASLRALAARVQRGEGLPKHHKRDSNALFWNAKAETE